MQAIRKMMSCNNRLTTWNVLGLKSLTLRWWTEIIQGDEFVKVFK